MGKIEKSDLISCTMCFLEKPICAAARLVHMPALPPSILELETTTPLTLHNGKFAVLTAELVEKGVGVASEGVEGTTRALVHEEHPVAPPPWASLVETFRCCVPKGTDDIGCAELVSLLDILTPGCDKEEFKELVDHSGLNHNGRVIYANFIEWLFTNAP